MTLHTSYDPKPLSVDRFDWAAWLGDYDEGKAVGYGKTREEALRELAEMLDQNLEDLLLNHPTVVEQ